MPFEEFKKSMHELGAIHFSYQQLKTAAAAFQVNRDMHPLSSYALLSTDHAKKLAKLTMTEEKSADKDNPVRERLNKILNIYQHSPYVLLIGPSGAGKSTLVKHDLMGHFRSINPGSKLYVGMDNIGAWLADKTPGTGKKVFFMDEINVAEAQGILEPFSMLFTKPPQVLLDGKWQSLPEGHRPFLYQGKLYALDPDHIIAFAGNFSDYEGRVQHRFFETFWSSFIMR